MREKSTDYLKLNRLNRKRISPYVSYHDLCQTSSWRTKVPADWTEAAAHDESSPDHDQWPGYTRHGPLPAMFVFHPNTSSQNPIGRPAPLSPQIKSHADADGGQEWQIHPVAVWATHARASICMGLNSSEPSYLTVGSRRHVASRSPKAPCIIITAIQCTSSSSRQTNRFFQLPLT